MDVINAIDDEYPTETFKSHLNYPYFELKGINILHLNIRSINCNFNQFLLTLDKFITISDVIILTECWFNPNEKTLLNHIDKFSEYYTEHTLNQNGGIVIYVKNDITLNNIKDYTLNSCELLKINLTIKNQILEIFCCYRSPSLNNTDQFLTDLSRILPTSTHYNYKIFVGDINIDILKKNCDVMNYLNLLANFDLSPLINRYTREISKTCIDHLFCSFFDSQKIKASVIESDITDHYPLFLKIINNQDSNKVKNHAYISHLQEDTFIKEIRNESWHDILNNNDINLATENFIEKINNYTVKHTKVKLLRKKYTPLKEWMTDSIVQSIRKRESLFKKLKKKSK